MVLGLANSRLKDYYDLWTAARLAIVTDEGLGEAIWHTFARRDTPLPVGLPEGLTAAFARDPTTQAQWAGFVRKSRLHAPSLAEVVEVAAGLAEGGFAVARRRRR